MPLLTIAIPTYNRATVLQETLARVCRQRLALPVPDEVEIMVCDNNSSDETPAVVQKHIENKDSIRYIRNEINIGPDKNFTKAANLAHGKYVWLLGDDDFPKPNALQTIVRTLSENEFGLLHLRNGNKTTLKTFTNFRKLANDISLFITFISVNIFRHHNDQFPLDKVNENNLGQLPLFFSAAASSAQNGILTADLLQTGQSANTNGGYNPYQVFLINYFIERNKYLPKIIDRETEKYRVFRILILDYTARLILGKRTLHTNKHAFRTLLSFYWYCPYFTPFLALKILVLLPAFLRKKL